MSISSLLWSFEGRIGRAQFWLGLLLVILIGVAFGIVVGLIDGGENLQRPQEMGPVASVIAVIGLLTMTIAQLAVYVKRFHDRGKSGWWVLIAFLPLIGFFWILIELGMLAGDPGPNTYGTLDTSASV
jgi:uncharacterized membrane protein YhaH (DUF805 family)